MVPGAVASVCDRRLVSLLCGLATLPIPACAHRGEASSAVREEGIIGCYRFTESDDGGGVPGLPWGIELLADSLTGWGAQAGAFVAHTWLAPDQVADHPFGYWRPISADSIRTGHPVGGGFDLVLGEDEDGGLSGWGRAVGDALPVGAAGGAVPQKPVRAVRVVCPGEPR